MSSRIFQAIIIQMKDATDRCIGVVDDQGFVVACSELGIHRSDMRYRMIPEGLETWKLETF